MTFAPASAVTVEDMLTARDARAARQGDLAREFGLSPTVPGGREGAVVSITLVIPGPDKHPAWADRVFASAMASVDAALGTADSPPGTVAEPHHLSTLDAESSPVPPSFVSDPAACDRPVRGVARETHDTPAGPQGYVVALGAPTDIKRRLVAAEDAHPWGRLFDLDVVLDGRPLTRSDVDAAPRRCLVCDSPASGCARSRTHDLHSLQAAIEGLLCS